MVLGIFFMFFRSRRIEARDNEPEASMPFAKPEPSPTSGPSSPDLGMSQADDDSAISRGPDDRGQRQPLMAGISPPESELERFPTAPAKARIYTELPTQIYKSELPA